MSDPVEDNDTEEDFADSPMTLDRFVRDNPITAVVGALVIGLLLGRIGLL